MKVISQKVSTYRDKRTSSRLGSDRTGFIAVDEDGKEIRGTFVSNKRWQGMADWLLLEPSTASVQSGREV